MPTRDRLMCLATMDSEPWTAFSVTTCPFCAVGNFQSFSSTVFPMKRSVAAYMEKARWRRRASSVRIAMPQAIGLPHRHFSRCPALSQVPPRYGPDGVLTPSQWNAAQMPLISHGFGRLICRRQHITSRHCSAEDGQFQRQLGLSRYETGFGISPQAPRWHGAAQSGSYRRH